MNTKQRTTLLIGTVLFLLMGLFPPWQYSLKTSLIVRRDAGFHFILSSPDIAIEEMSDVFGVRKYPRGYFAGKERVSIASFEAQINTSQLLLQWLMLLVTCGGLFFFLTASMQGGNQPVESVPGEPDEPAQPQDTAPLEKSEDHLNVADVTLATPELTADVRDPDGHETAQVSVQKESPVSQSEESKPGPGPSQSDGPGFAFSLFFALTTIGVIMLVTAIVALSSVPFWVSSIYINWMVGLLPAILVRFVFFEQVFSKREAKITAGSIGFGLFIMVSLVSHGLGITPNMAPVAVWTLVTYAILRYKSSTAHTSDAGDLKTNHTKS